MNNDFFKWENDNSGFRKLAFIEFNFTKEIYKFNNYNGQTRVCSKCKNELPLNDYFFCSGGEGNFHRYCKKCEGTDKYGWGRKFNYKLNIQGFHYCSKCDRILPLNIYYFNISHGKNNKTGFQSNCKECIRGSFSIGIINEYKDIFQIKDNYKICSSCLIELPNTDDYFFKKSDRENGSTQCKKCKGFEYGIYKYNVVYKATIPKGKRYCVSCKELVDEELIRQDCYCPACYKSKNKEYHNKPEVKQYRRKFRHKRIALKKEYLVELTKEQYNETLLYFNNSCAYCGLTEDEHRKEYSQSLHQDHIIPLSRGGNYTQVNIIPACQSCNCTKNSKSLHDFFIYSDKFTIDRYKKILTYILLLRTYNSLGGDYIANVSKRQLYKFIMEFLQRNIKDKISRL